MQTIRIAPFICQVLKAQMGLARIERAKFLSRSDARCRRSFYYGTRTAVPTLTPMPAGGLGEEISESKPAVHPARRIY